MQHITERLSADHLVNQLLKGYKLLGINKVEGLQTGHSLRCWANTVYLDYSTSVLLDCKLVHTRLHSQSVIVEINTFTCRW